MWFLFYLLFYPKIFIIFGAKWKIMKNIVGGIFYKPQKNQNEELDIYGDVIDWSDVKSYIHNPVKVDSPTSEVIGYQKQYQYGDRTLNTEDRTLNTEETIKPNVATTSSPIGIIPTSGSTSRKIHKIESGINVGNMQALLDEAAKHNIYFRITSGLREGATTSNGSRSWHALGEAIDVTPIEGQTWDELRQQVQNSPEFVKWMQSKGYGILDETTKDMLARTGGSGAHWHIGKDKSALEGLKQFLV